MVRVEAKVRAMIHFLKTWPIYFQAVKDLQKTFEIRKEDDRKFSVGDILVLQEWDPESLEYTDRALRTRVSYLIRGPEWGIPVATVVLGLANVDIGEE